MSTINNKPYSSPKNINLKGGLLRFDVTHASNPFGDASYGLYVNSSGSLIFRSTTTSTQLGAAGGGGGAAPTWEQVFQGDQSMQLAALGSFTIDRNSGNNDVLTITNTGTGSGQLIQITNAGTGLDIQGHDATWSFSKTGNLIANKAAFAGDDGADSITLTIGDVVVSDGSFTLTDADNAASLTITNDTATTNSVIVFAGSGQFRGDTTHAFMTITPSGLDQGEAVYLPLAAITTGKGLYVISGTTLTSGGLVVIESGAGTAITSTTGALLEVKSGDTAGTNAVLVGMSTAATDETKLLKLLASDALALGACLNITASSMTTGYGIQFADLAALTTGWGIKILSSATAITGTGRLFLSSATGATSTSGVLNEFIMTQTDETVLLQLSNATAGQVDGCLLNVVQSTVDTQFTGAGSAVARFTGSFTTGSASVVSIVSANTTAGNALLVTASSVTTTNGRAIKVVAEGLTTGVGIGFAHTNSVIADGGSMMRLSDSGIATGGATNGTILDIANTGSVAGTLVKMYSNCASQTATTILDIAQAGATLTAYTDSIVSITGGFSGNSSTGNVLSLTGVHTTQGNALLITASSATTGAGGAIKVVAEGLTTGSGISFVHTASIIADGGSMLRLTDSGVATGGATSGTMLDILSTGAVVATLVKIYSNVASQTAVTALEVKQAGATLTAFTGSFVSFTGAHSGNSSTGQTLLVTSANTTAGNAVKIDAAALTTGVGLLVTSAGTLVTTGSLVSLVSAASTATGVLRIAVASLTNGWAIRATSGNTVSATGGMLYMDMGASTTGTGLQVITTGVYTGTTGLIGITATQTTTGTIVDITNAGRTTGDIIKITGNTTLTGNWINCYNGAASDFTVSRYGATTILGTAIGTAALTLTKGDIVLGEGAIVGAKRNIEDVTTTNSIAITESGKVFFLNSATEFVSTLPSVATSSGCHFTFIVKAAPAGANYTIVTTASENKIVAFQNSVAGDAGDSSVFATPDDTISFVSAQSVEGDKVDLYCDGAYWYAYAVSKVAAGITFTIAS